MPFIMTGDITALEVDVIVNAANESLLGGGGVDGAIHQAAGPRLLARCRTLRRCATGEAKITPGFDLKAKRVIHTVGPVWQGGMHGEDDKLERCYQNCFRLARDQDLDTIAFPAISTGVYGFPKARAAAIALKVMALHQAGFRKIIACCFSTEDADIYRRTPMP